MSDSFDAERDDAGDLAQAWDLVPSPPTPAIPSGGRSEDAIGAYRVGGPASTDSIRGLLPQYSFHLGGGPTGVGPTFSLPEAAALGDGDRLAFPAPGDVVAGFRIVSE